MSPKLERAYDSLTGVIEGLQAARQLGIKDVTVTSTYKPGSAEAPRADGAFARSGWSYWVELSERDLSETDERSACTDDPEHNVSRRALLKTAARNPAEVKWS